MATVYVFNGMGDKPTSYASEWGICSTNSEATSKLFDSVVWPWITKKADSARNQVHYMDKPSSRLYPGINIHGTLENDVKDNIVYGSRQLRQTSKGTFEEWRAAKESGRIILRPMTAYKLKGHATPGFGSPSSPGPILGPLTAEWFYGPFKQGICVARWNQVPALELDCSARAYNGYYTRFNDAYLIPVNQYLVDSAIGTVIDDLALSVPNRTLVTNLVSEANSATFDIGTEIGEMPETIKMIIKGIKEGIKLLLRAKREVKQNLSSGSVATDAASIWMSYRYGMMPIVYSINDGLDLLNMEVRKYQSFRGRADEPIKVKGFRGYKLSSAPMLQGRCFLKYGYDVNSVIHQGLKLNLASTAWELIPLSFVFDWLFQVGDFLTAYFTPGAVNQIACSYSYRVNGTFIFTHESNGSIITIDCDYYRVETINPDSFIGINSDVFLSYKRALDAISLSWLLFKKDTSKG